MFGNGGGKQTAEDLETQFLGMVPLNQEVREGGDYGIPVIISNPECNSSVAIAEIASKLMDAFERKLTFNFAMNRMPFKETVVLFLLYRVCLEFFIASRHIA